MSTIRSLDDLDASERAQFEKAVAESPTSETREWEQLMLVITLGSYGNGDAYERRQAVRRLFAATVTAGTP